MRGPIKVGIVGLGTRGRRYAEVFATLRDSELRWVCGVEPGRLEAVELYPRAAPTSSLDKRLADESLEAVVVACPLPERLVAASAALAAGKHVFVEGPLSGSAEDVLDLAARARQCGRCLFIGSAVLFDPALRKLEEIVETGPLGELLYLHAENRTLGGVERSADVLWTLGARDLAAILYLLDDIPVTVSASGEAHLRPDSCDVIFCLLRFATGVNARLHLSRLDPQTVRRLTLVGSRRMAVHDETVGARGLTLFEHSISRPRPSGRAQRIRIRPGDVLSPVLPGDDPDVLMCETFLAAVRRGRPLDAEARLATNVASVLEALEASIEAGGAAQPVVVPTPRLPNVVALDRR